MFYKHNKHTHTRARVQNNTEQQPQQQIIYKKNTFILRDISTKWIQGAKNIMNKS
jgi:hypothetical protein